MEPVNRTISTRDGVKLYTQVVEKGAKVWLIATHGIGEHLGRHGYLCKLFGEDVNVFQWDLRGHGRSAGEKAYIQDFKTYTRDLEDCISYLQDKYSMDKFILFGHSMGALITCGFAKYHLSERLRPECIIVNAPPVGFPGILGKVVGALPNSVVEKLSSFKPSIPLGGLVELKYLSHKPEVIEDYLSDELNHMKLHSKLILEMANYSREVFSSSINCKTPALCTYGSEDGIVSVEDLEKFFTQVEVGFELKKISGAYHEIHNELDKYRLIYFDILKEKINNVVFKNN